MSADIVNLRQARKTRARKERETRAAENRTLFGRTKAEKQRDAFEKAKEAKRIEGHLMNNDPASGGADGKIGGRESDREK